MIVNIVTEKEFVEIVKSIKGVTFASLKARTIPDMRKTNNPYFGRVRKHSTVNVLMGNWHYGNSLRNQANREGLNIEIEVLPRKWGNRLNKAGLVEHNGKFYLEVKIEGVSSTVYKFMNGKKLTDEQEKELKTFERRNPEGSSSQSDLNKKIILRDYKISNIVSARFNGRTYVVRNISEVKPISSVEQPKKKVSRKIVRQSVLATEEGPLA